MEVECAGEVKLPGHRAHMAGRVGWSQPARRKWSGGHSTVQTKEEDEDELLLLLLLSLDEEEEEREEDEDPHELDELEELE